MDVGRALQFCLEAQGCPDTLSESSEAGWKKAPVGSRPKSAS